MFASCVFGVRIGAKQIPKQVNTIGFWDSFATVTVRESRQSGSSSRVWRSRRCSPRVDGPSRGRDRSGSSGTFSITECGRLREHVWSRNPNLPTCESREWTHLEPYLIRSSDTPVHHDVDG